MFISRFVLLVAFLLFTAISPRVLVADIVFLQDGRLLFGQLSDDDHGQRLFRGSGEEQTLATDQVLRVETSAAALGSLPLSVVLADNSVLWGALAEYDDELGIFLDISFGTLDIPFSAIKAVYWKEAARLAPGTGSLPMNFGVGLSVLQPLDNGLFGLTYSPQIFQNTAIPLVPGLSIGPSFEYEVLTYRPDAAIRYRIGVLLLNVTQKVLSLLTPHPSSFPVAPFVRLGAGISLVSVVDESATAQNHYYGTMNTVLRGALGGDYSLVEHWVVGADAQVQAIVQKEGLSWMLGGGLALRYEL